MQETQKTRVQSLDWEDPLEKGMATHSSTLAWRIPWTEEPDRLQSTKSRTQLKQLSMHAHNRHCFKYKRDKEMQEICIQPSRNLV